MIKLRGALTCIFVYARHSDASPEVIINNQTNSYKSQTITFKMQETARNAFIIPISTDLIPPDFGKRPIFKVIADTCLLLSSTVIPEFEK